MSKPVHPVRRKLGALVVAGALATGLFAAIPLSADAAPRIKVRSNWAYTSSGLLSAAPKSQVTKVSLSDVANGVDFSAQRFRSLSDVANGV